MKRIIASIAFLAMVVLGFSAPALAKGHDHPKPQHVPVNVCHATSSDTNPYVFLTVDDDSTKLKGHLEHRNDPNKTWKSDGFWNGVYHEAGAPKPDLIQSYTDTDGVFHDLDGDITEAVCDGQVVPPTCENHPTANTCPQPEAVHRSTSETAKDCATKTVTTTVHNYTTEYLWDVVLGAWTLGPETEDEGSPVITTEPTTPQDCPTTVLPKDANAGVTVKPATCDKKGSANYYVNHAFLSGIVFDRSVGHHVVKFEAVAGHLFANGTTVLKIPYDVPAATGDCPVEPPVTTPNPPTHNTPPTTLTHLPNAGLDDASQNWMKPVGFLLLLVGIGLAGVVTIRKNRA